MSDNPQPTTTIIKEGGSGGGWIFAIILLVLIAVGGWYAFNYFKGESSSDINVQVEVPNELMPNNQ